MIDDHSVETPNTNNEPALDDLLNDLLSESEHTRLTAVQTMSRLAPATELSLRALEKTAAQDQSQVVRQAALEALTNPAYRDMQRQTSRLQASARQTMLTEIGRWQADGLLAPHQVDLLRQRYEFDPPAAATVKVASPDPAKPAPSLSEVLLSETTIKVALYLGAFFVLAAAAILAAVVEGLRLPVLGAATLGFLVAALALKRRLPQASFVLFVVFSFLLPIDAGVLLDQVEVSRSSTQLYWIGVTVGLGLVWVGGTFIYTSRFFSVLAWVTISATALQIGRWFDLTAHLDLFLLELATLLGLAGVVLLRRWQNRAFSLPLLGLSQIQQIGLLGISALMVVLALVDEPLPAAGWWLVIGTTWLLGSIFYVTSDRLTHFALFPWLAVAAVLPVPLLWLHLGSPSILAVAVVTCGWGVILALLGEVLARLPEARLRAYGLPLSLGGLAMLALAPLLGLFDRVAVSLGCLLVATGVYLILTLYRPRWWSWSSALLAGTMAYFAVFFLPAMQRYDLYPGFALLWPALVLLTIHLVARRGFQARTLWHLPPLLLGGGLGLMAGLVLVVTGLIDEPGRAAIAFVIVSGYAMIFALADRRSVLGYGATGSLAVAVVFGLIYAEQDSWLTPLMILALGYVATGFGLTLTGRFGGWATMLRWSGLILGALVSLTAPIQDGAAAVVGTAMAATFFAAEAWYRRNIWLGFPATLLYLGAYFILLLELDVTEPQVYSIGAALLGFIMHYLLVRINSNVAAFLTGLVSQLILLSTTYIQMVATDRFLFFLVLFVQALIVLTYGLVVRSRSLVGVPLVFVVLGVITVVISALSGIPALLLVGCTGFLLLLLGIAALLQRERLLSVSSRLSHRLTGWQA
jgi:hypothetical protein